jgi:luciferase family oxidoreductase group 1
VTTTAPIRLSVLDVGVFQLSVQLAPRAEALGYDRYWISEHHGERAITNPTLLVPVIAGLTETIRVGTAGILLRFQSALAVAENFRMLTRLFPGRIDLGLAHAPAGSPAQTVALSDGRIGDYSPEDHDTKVTDVQGILCGRLPSQHPLRGERIDPPLTTAGPPALWVHSTSPNGASLAAKLGSHYSFHDHYNAEYGPRSVRRYVDEFRPSPELAAPHWSVCVAGYCGEDEADVQAAKTERFDGLPTGRHTILGTIDHWREQLAALSDAYETRDIVVQTLGGKYDLEHQVGSLARIAEAARSLS